MVGELWQEGLPGRPRTISGRRSPTRNTKVWLDRVGGEVVGEDYVLIGGSEFAPIFNKIRQAQPDFIFSTVIGNSDVAMHKQFLAEGFKADKLPIASLTTGEIEVRAMGAEAGAGRFLGAVLPGARQSDEPEVRGKLSQEQVRRWRRDPLQHGRDLSCRVYVEEWP